MKKFVLTKETKILANGTTLHRIQAVSDFTHVNGTTIRAGDFGGWIEHEGNLSHSGLAWVLDEALVFGNAKVCDNALVGGIAQVYDSATVYGNAVVYGQAKVNGAVIDKSVKVHDMARVYGNAQIYGGAQIYGEAWVNGEADVCGMAQVYGNAWVNGRAELCNNAKVSSTNDYAVYKNTWSSHRWFTYTRSDGMWKVGCFYGTGKELIAKAYKDSKRSGQCYEAIVRAQEAINKVLEKQAKS